MRITQLTVSCNFSETSNSLQELNQVSILLQEYKSCLATRKSDEATKTNKEINYLITNEINTTGWELRSFANDLLLKGCFEESIPVYFAATSLFKKEGNLEGMCMCVGVDGWGGMHGANRGMIERDVTMKEVVKRHVIPLMHDVKNLMSKMTSVSEKDKCGWMSQVLDYIAWSEEVVGDDVAAKEAWEESKVWWERRGRIEEERRRRIEEERRRIDEEKWRIDEERRRIDEERRRIDEERRRIEEKRAKRCIVM